MPRNPRNVSLIIGLSIPVLMVVFIAVAINGPRWFSDTEPPKYDFLYSVGPPMKSALYEVENGRLVRREPSDDQQLQREAGQVRLFIHDVSENRSREISLGEASTLGLDSSIRSPDGFTVTYGRRGSWFIFGIGGDANRRYLVKDDIGQRLDLLTDSDGIDYYWNFRFLAWVTSE